MRVVGVLTVIVAAVLGGCAGAGGHGGGAPASSGSPGGPAPDQAAPDADPLALIGLWTVADTDEEPGTVLRIAGHELSLWRTCGVILGSWRAGDGLFLASMSGGSGRCFSPGDATTTYTPGWLLRAAGYRADGDNRVLVDASGATVARLLAGGKPKIGPDHLPSAADPPVITDQDRAIHAEPAALPAGLASAGRAALLGRWVQVTGSSAAFVQFKDDGSWKGSDGCNGVSGRWVSNAGGLLLTTRGMSTFIACKGIPVGSWLNATARAGLGDGVLVLVNAAGAEVGRLRKG